MVKNKNQNQNLIIMKKTFLILATAMVGTFANAQTGAGSIMLGGNIGYSSTTTSTTITPAPAVPPADVKSSTMNFQIMGGYFIMNGLAVGLGIDYGSTTIPMSGTITAGPIKWDDKTSGFTISLFGRKYMDVTETFKMWGQASLGFGSTTFSSSSIKTVPGPPTTTILSPNPDVKGSTLGINIGPGFTWFPSEKWGFDFALANLISYTSTSSEATAGTVTAKTKVSDIGINISTMTPTLGLFYYIGKK